MVKRHYETEAIANPNIAMGIDLLGMAGVPARLAYGVLLNEENSGQEPFPLLEYYDGAFWKVRNPLEPSKILDGREIFVWHRGGGPLLEVNGGENSKVTFTVVKDRIPLATLTDLRDSPLLVSTILALPASERAVFRYIVLIPLGAFVVVLMRNIIGIPTLGTFMPVFLALALLEIKPVQGILMFTILVGSGLWFRFLLSRMNLLVVPRVAACVVIVTLLMMLMGVISYNLGMSVGIKITLFPMIIIAWTSGTNVADLGRGGETECHRSSSGVGFRRRGCLLFHEGLADSVLGVLFSGIASHSPRWNSSDRSLHRLPPLGIDPLQDLLERLTDEQTSRHSA